MPRRGVPADLATVRAPRAPALAAGSGLLTPVFLVALVVMALNDQVLKEAVPSVATGKLSDLAGMVVAPVLAVSLVEVAVRRPVGERAWWVAAGLTGVVFSLVKLWAPAASVYEHVFGFARWPVDAAADAVAGRPLRDAAPVRLWRDATDLVALPLLLLVPWMAGRRGQSTRCSVPPLPGAPSTAKRSTTMSTGPEVAGELRNRRSSTSSG